MSRIKEGDVNRDDILLPIYKIDPIAFLSAQVASEHPFEKIGHQLRCIRSVIMNEGHTNKHPRKQGKDVTIKVETMKGYFIAKR